ncbi:ABC transporter permease [Faecalimonas umbilicata]|uniref:ABC transporter permease n=1 Tax=Faecalimonas umbilicata TaxID=1912855 RepID=UPI0032C0E2E8
MSVYIQNFLKFRPLLMELVTRDIKTKYRRSILGVLWTLLNPLLMMLVLSVVFSHIFKFQVENYPLYILSGQVVFNFFSESTSSAMSSIINNAPLIKKVYIPKYLFTLSRVASSVVNVMASFCALIVVMVFSGIELNFTVLLLVVPMGILIIFSTGIGLLLATVAVKFRDIIHLYGVLITALTYLTPVIYPISILQAKIRFFVELNPLTGILNMFRNLMLYNTLPTVGQLLTSVTIAIGTFLLGLFVFYKNQDKFILNI